VTLNCIQGCNDVFQNVLSTEKECVAQNLLAAQNMSCDTRWHQLWI